MIRRVNANIASDCTVDKDYHVAIVGGGPAGIGPLFAALQQGHLAGLLDRGVALFESSGTLGNGRLGDFQLNSDTLSNAFLEILDNDPAGLLGGIESHLATQNILAYRGSACPLPVAGDFVRCLGERLLQIFQRHNASDVFLHTPVASAQRTSDGSFLVEGGQSRKQIRCRNLVIATGGGQSLSRAIVEPVLGRSWLEEPRFRAKSILTGEILQGRADELLTQRLSKRSPRVVILGASHSAFSVAWYLLDKGFSFPDGGVQILHRGRPKVYFGSAEDAIEAGYSDFDEQDFCPLTKRLYRLGGLRFDGRRLLMQLWQLGGEPPESRVQLQSLNDVRESLETMLSEADLIVPAFGYRPNALDLYEGNNRVELLADTGGPLVDDHCRVLSKNGRPLPGVFGIGLASGFIPSGKLGGEPSFKGQTNGYWLYQNGVGDIILDALLADVAANPNSGDEVAL